MSPAGFLAWWGGELAALLPGGPADSRRAVRLRLDGESLHIETDGQPAGKARIGKAGKPLAGAPLKAAAAAAAEGRPVILEIAPGQALGRQIRVARAAEQELEGVLSFEIERHTPFRADEVAYAWRPDPSQDDPQHVGVDLVAVPRRILDPLCAGLDAHGLTPAEVLARPDAAHAPLSLPDEGTDGPPASPLLPVAVTALLVGAVLLSPLWRVEYAADARRAEAAAAQRAFAAEAGGRDAAARSARAVAQLAAARAERPTVLATLDALSGLLPDGTWLMRFAMTGPEAALEGRTQSAVDLVGRLEAAPRVAAVAYAAPVTRDPVGGGERFGFTVTLSGRE